MTSQYGQIMAGMAQWISRLAQKLAELYDVTAIDGHGVDDADARRISRELEAIRAHFPDHA